MVIPTEVGKNRKWDRRTCMIRKKNFLRWVMIAAPRLQTVKWWQTSVVLDDLSWKHWPRDAPNQGSQLCGDFWWFWQIRVLLPSCPRVIKHPMCKNIKHPKMMIVMVMAIAFFFFFLLVVVASQRHLLHLAAPLASKKVVLLRRSWTKDPPRPCLGERRDTAPRARGVAT